MSAGRRFDWERAVISAHGPKRSTTRHVLLTLATYTDRNLECWPRVATLADACALSAKCVVDHVEFAAQEGWIKKKFGRGSRMKHAGEHYTLTMPPGVESTLNKGGSGERRSIPGQTYPQTDRTTVARTEPHATGVEDGSEGVERSSAGVEPRIAKPLDSDAISAQTVQEHINKHVLNSKTLNFSKSRTDKKSEPVKSARQWGDELGVQRFGGEHEGHYQARVLKALEAHRAKAVPATTATPATAPSVVSDVAD